MSDNSTTTNTTSNTTTVVSDNIVKPIDGAKLHDLVPIQVSDSKCVRYSFMCYWQNMPPSANIFFGSIIPKDLSDISYFENIVFQRMSEITTDTILAVTLTGVIMLNLSVSELEHYAEFHINHS